MHHSWQTNLLNLQGDLVARNGRSKEKLDNGRLGVEMNLFGHHSSAIPCLVRRRGKAELLGVQTDFLRVGLVEFGVVDGKVNLGDSLKGKGLQVGRQVQVISVRGGVRA